MKKIIMLLLGFMSVTEQGLAFAEGDFNPWTVDGSFGLAFYPDMMHQDGQTSTSRFSLGRELLTQSGLWLGIEAGIQSGNTMRLVFPKEDIDALGGVPIEAQIKPMLDVLISLKTEPLNDFPLYAWVKGGAAFRQMQFDRESVNDLNHVSPEMQIGLGYQINEQAAITLGYQNIWGNHPTLIVNSIDDTGVINNIPSQQAVMLGFSFAF